MEGERVGVTLLKKENRIFRLYRSMLLSESERVPSAVRPLLVALIIGLVVCIGGFFMFVRTFDKGVSVDKAEASGKFSKPGDPPLTGKSALAWEDAPEKVAVAERGSAPPVRARASGVVRSKSGKSAKDVLGSGDYERLFMSPAVDGSPVFYTGSGLVSDQELIREYAVTVGSRVYVPKWVRDGAGARSPDKPSRAIAPSNSDLAPGSKSALAPVPGGKGGSGQVSVRGGWSGYPKSHEKKP
jgi:hypothetical protein